MTTRSSRQPSLTVITTSCSPRSVTEVGFSLSCRVAVLVDGLERMFQKVTKDGASVRVKVRSSPSRSLTLKVSSAVSFRRIDAVTVDAVGVVNTGGRPGQTLTSSMSK